MTSTAVVWQYTIY